MAELTPRGVLLSVDDLNAAVTLFSGVLGMNVDFSDGDHFAQLSKDGFRISLATAQDHPAPGSTSLMVKADSVRAAMAELSAAGAETVIEASDGRDEVRGVVRVAGGTTLVVYGPA